MLPLSLLYYPVAQCHASESETCVISSSVPEYITFANNDNIEIRKCSGSDTNNNSIMVQELFHSGAILCSNQGLISTNYDCSNCDEYLLIREMNNAHTLNNQMWLLNVEIKTSLTASLRYFNGNADESSGIGDTSAMNKLTECCSIISTSSVNLTEYLAFVYVNLNFNGTVIIIGFSKTMASCKS